MSTQEKFPELNPFLRPLGIKRTFPSQLRFMACLVCQIERSGIATGAEVNEMDCAPRGTINGSVRRLERLGIISRTQTLPNGTVGRPPMEISFNMEITDEFRAALKPFRPCEQLIEATAEPLPDHPATQEHLVVINNSRLAGSGRSDLIG